MDQTGDLKLEGNVEFRFPIFGSLNGAFFVDAGNVWLIRKNENRPGGTFKIGSMLQDLAVGTGGGLRYDMGFLVLRLDLGVGIHDPANEHQGGYYNIGKFKDGLALHFAIGYPF
jgi:outer membrane protein assembly factor BamA